MQTRILGRTGLSVSVLGFGCGAVGGLMVRGDPAEQERAVAIAVEHGVNYFDTAPPYGDGASERNLGRVLAKLRPNVFVGTKIRISPDEKNRVAAAVSAGLDASLRRLGREHVDLFQLHNPVTLNGTGETLTPELVVGEVVPAFQTAQARGKARFIGITAVGETSALYRVLDSGLFDTAQVPYNLLNPSAGGALPAGAPGQDYGNLLGRMAAGNMGAIGIRILAGGALSGTSTRHPNASPPPQPIGSGPDYEADLSQAQQFTGIVQDAGAADLAEVAIRFAITQPALATALIGIATPEQLAAAVRAAEKGALANTILARIGTRQVTG